MREQEGHKVEEKSS
jgi:hypothetical protein